MNEYLFSYGTLQKENVQLKLFGRLLNGTPDVLNGYRLSAIEITDAAFLSTGEETFQQTLVRSGSKGDNINGTAFGISTEELRVADGYEPENYKRIKVVLQSGVAAWVYVVV